MKNKVNEIVRIKDLSIATLEGRRVIDDLSIEIIAGENRAIVENQARARQHLLLHLWDGFVVASFMKLDRLLSME